MDMIPAAPESSRVLVIDDEKGLRDFLSYELKRRGYSVASAADGAQGLALLDGARFDIVISDVRMPGMDGVELLKEVKRTAPRVEVVLTTGFGSVETAVEAMKQGAFDFLLKPVEADDLAAVVERAAVAGRLKSLLALYESSLTLFRSVELDEILPAVADASRRLLAADRTVIFLKEEGHLRAAGEAPPPPDRTGLAARLRGACASAASGALGACVDLAGAGAALVQPLATGGEVLGYLAAARVSRPEPFSASDLRHAAIFAAQAAQAVRNASLFRELRAAQDRLVRSERLNALGLLSAGIGHEINNPLTVILNASQLLLDSAAVSGDDRESAEVILSQAKHCRDVSATLLDFARHREAPAAVVELVPVLESALALVRVDGRRRTPLRRIWPAGTLRVRADPVQLKQIVVNLVRNALHAMEAVHGAELTLRLTEHAGTARLQVEDGGPGLPPEVVKTLFDPLVSTKPAGEGTGLGLYLCRLLVERNGGRITARNGEEGGAVFTVELPLAP